ncbi:conserved hypothetical protein, partial [Ricinus communis]
MPIRRAHQVRQHVHLPERELPQRRRHRLVRQQRPVRAGNLALLPGLVPGGLERRLVARGGEDPHRPRMTLVQRLVQGLGEVAALRRHRHRQMMDVEVAHALHLDVAGHQPAQLAGAQAVADHRAMQVRIQLMQPHPSRGEGRRLGRLILPLPGGVRLRAGHRLLVIAAGRRHRAVAPAGESGQPLGAELERRRLHGRSSNRWIRRHPAGHGSQYTAEHNDHPVQPRALRDPHDGHAELTARGGASAKLPGPRPTASRHDRPRPPFRHPSLLRDAGIHPGPDQVDAGRQRRARDRGHAQPWAA